MQLRKITLTSFRNFSSQEVVPGPRFNVFHGRNGHGKTNLLEAIFLAGTMKSFRHARNAELIRWGDPFALVKAVVEKEGVSREVSLLVEKEGKKARVDRKSLERLGDFFGILNVVAFSADDLGMVRGAPEARRRYLDRAVFSAAPGYLAAHHAYSRILRNRNALLKSGSRRSLDIWSERLATAGSELFRERKSYLSDIDPLFRSLHREITGKDTAGFSYSAAAQNAEEYAAWLLDTLTRNTEEELRRGTTLYGPHREDIRFTVGEKPLRHYGSQGEIRSFVLALKMAEIEYLHRRHGAPPVLLLDDISSELDAERNANLMHFLEEREMQVFITTTGMENLRRTDNEKYRTFLVSEGAIQ